MTRIEKKHLRKMDCPSCKKPKLRFEHSADGQEPNAKTTAVHKFRCDACKTQLLETDATIQAALNEVLSELTPPPIASAHR